MTVAIFSIVIVYAVICTPVSIWCTSDILIAESVFPLIWDEIMTIVNYLYYWSVFSFALYACFRFDVVHHTPFILLTGISALVRYPLNLIAGYFVNGFPVIDDFFIEFPYVLFDIFVDLLIFALYWIAMRLIKRKIPVRKYEKRSEAFAKFVPFQSLFSIQNPVQCSLLVGSGALSLLKMISRIIYDVSYGAPGSLPDLLWMVFYYTVDILGFFIGCIACVLIVNRIALSEARSALEMAHTEQEDKIL
ncbi:MAG: hypothetical protein E7666_00150 [Ruminococcaceae bacterium]|nr:hypothetical protein [Oscillospiraceae bacterium]